MDKKDIAIIVQAELITKLQQDNQLLLDKVNSLTGELEQLKAEGEDAGPGNVQSGD